MVLHDKKAHMTHRRLARAVACGIAAATLSLLPATAHAQTEAVTDSKKDVVTYSETGSEPAPSVEKADITRARVAHTRGRIVLTTKVRRLAARDWVAGWEIETPTRRYSASHMRMTGFWMTDLSTRSGNEVACKRMTVDVDRDRDRVRLSIPRTCLKDPRWVRVGIGFLTFDGDDFEQMHVDDARLDGTIRERGLVPGPRIKVG